MKEQKNFKRRNNHLAFPKSSLIKTKLYLGFVYEEPQQTSMRRKRNDKVDTGSKTSSENG